MMSMQWKEPYQRSVDAIGVPVYFLKRIYYKKGIDLMAKLPVSSSYGLTDTQFVENCIPCGQSENKITPCCKKSLVVSCGHADRTFKLHLFDGLPSRNGEYVIQVIPDVGSQDDIVHTTAFTACKKPGSEGMPYLTFSGPDGTVNNRFQSAAFHARPPASPPSVGATFAACLARFLDKSGSQCSKYRLSVQSCDGLYDPYYVIVESFPKREISGKVEFGVVFDKKKSSNYKLKKDVQFELIGSIKLTLDKSFYTIQSKRTEKADGKSSYPSVFPGIEKFLRKMHESLSILSDAKLEKSISVDVKSPKIALECNISNAESKTKYYVYDKGKISISMDPLIGFYFSIDLLEYLLKFGGPVGQALAIIKDQLEDGVGNKAYSVQGKLKIELKAGADIKGSVEWTVDDGNFDGTGKVEAEIPFSLTGVAEAKGRVFNMSVTAHSSVGGESAVGCRFIPLTSKEKPDVYFQFYWTGLKIFFQNYIEFGEEIGADESSFQDGDKTTHEIIGEYAWPDQKKSAIVSEAI